MRRFIWHQRFEFAPGGRRPGANGKGWLFESVGLRSGAVSIERQLGMRTAGRGSDSERGDG